jgi:hypothetical protein
MKEKERRKARTTARRFGRRLGRQIKRAIELRDGSSGAASKVRHIDPATYRPKEVRAQIERPTKRIIPIKTDGAFWRAWHDDPRAMQHAGYRITHTDRGRWKAWIER